LHIQNKIKNKELELIWSYILEFENSQNPHDERKNTIIRWKKIAMLNIIETPALIEKAKKVAEFGVKAKDTLHVASAIEGNADYFLTTDDRLLSSLKRSKMIEILNPTDYIKVL
jgi:predicted nucleic acid-binding protein